MKKSEIALHNALSLCKIRLTDLSFNTKLDKFTWRLAGISPEMCFLQCFYWVGTEWILVSAGQSDVSAR